MANIIFSKQTEKEEKPSFQFFDPKTELREVMKRYDRQTNLIIGVLVVSLVIMIVMTATLLIDSFHFNSAVYREYSTKIDSQNESVEENKLLLEQIKQYQTELINNQKIIKNLSK